MLEQFGFCPKHSAQRKLLLVVEFLSEKPNMKISAAASFLGVAKSFAKIWYEGLIFKLFRTKYLS